MLSLLSALFQIVTMVMKYIDRRSAEEAGKAKEIVASWERNNGFVSAALAAGEAKRTELTNDPSKLRDRDENQRD